MRTFSESKHDIYLHVTRKTQNSNVERGSKMIGLIIIIIFHALTEKITQMKKPIKHDQSKE